MDHSEVPDRSKSDFYCRICESHMNSYEIWKLHVAGSRHQKNLKKMPGEAPSKATTKKLRGVRPIIQNELDEYEGVLVGLSFVCERQASVQGGENLYHCHLCHGSFTRMDLIEHLESVKHKILFFKQCDPVVYKNVETTKSAHSEAAMVHSYASSWERQNGREIMEVEVLKSTNWGPPARPYYHAPPKSWLSATRRLDHRGDSPPSSSYRGSSSRSVAGSDHHAGSSSAVPASKRSSDGASSSSKRRSDRLLTPEEVQDRFTRLPTTLKVKCLIRMMDGVELETSEDRANAMKVLGAVSKLHLLPTYRSLPAELQRQVRLDLGPGSPSISNVMTDVLQGKKSYYFRDKPFGEGN